MLSTTAQHAIRALIELSLHEKEDRVPGRHLAKEARIPANYLSKILLSMQKGGIIDASRGVGGGYTLARPASEILLIEVVEIFDGIRTDPACFLGIRERCSDDHPCSAHPGWREVRLRYLDFLETTTIGQLAEEHKSNTEARP